MNRDTLISIFEYLEPGEFPVVLEVCKSWNRAGNHPHMFNWYWGHPDLLMYFPYQSLDPVYNEEIYRDVKYLPEVWRRQFPNYPQLPSTYMANVAAVREHIIPELVIQLVIRITLNWEDIATEIFRPFMETWCRFEKIDTFSADALDAIGSILDTHCLKALIMKVLLTHYVAPDVVFRDEMEKGAVAVSAILMNRYVAVSLNDDPLYCGFDQMICFYKAYPDLIAWNYAGLYEIEAITANTIMHTSEIWSKVNWAHALMNLKFPIKWLEKQFFKPGAPLQHVNKSYICIGQKLPEQFIIKWFAEGPYNNPTNWDMIFQNQNCDMRFLSIYRGFGSSTSQT